MVSAVKSMPRRAADYPYFDGGFVALAHRGGAELPSNLGRENTVHAFTEAARLGYRWFETDVHVTVDGTLIAFHDDVLDRVTDATGRIDELTWNEVRKARIGGRDPIPTLAELFETFPDARFNIDIKAPGAVTPLAKAINSHQAHRRVCVGSFGQERLAAFRRLMGRQVATAVSPFAVARGAYLPSGRMIADPGVAFQIPTEMTVRGHRIRVLSRGLIERAHQAGKQVHVWTINDPVEMEKLIDLGVDGLVTDRIDLLKQVLVGRNLWHQ